MGIFSQAFKTCFKSNPRCLAILAADHHKSCLSSTSCEMSQTFSLKLGFFFSIFSKDWSILFETGWLKPRSSLSSLSRRKEVTWPLLRAEFLTKTVSTTWPILQSSRKVMNPAALWANHRMWTWSTPSSGSLKLAKIVIRNANFFWASKVRPKAERSGEFTFGIDHCCPNHVFLSV